MAFTNPVAGTGMFEAWAGSPPGDLKKSLDGQTLVEGMVQDKPERGVAWCVTKAGPTNQVRLVISQELVPFDEESFTQIPEGMKPEELQQTIPSSLDVEKLQEAQENEDKLALEDGKYDSSRPKDAISGIWSGVKHAGGGVLAGAAVLVAAPAAGAA